MTEATPGAVVITGASRGVGRELALGYARRARDLILIARSPDQLTEVGDACRAAGAPGVQTITADLTRDDDLGRVVDGLERLTAGGVATDTLINNAGVLAGMPFAGQPQQSIAQSVALNCAAPTLLTSTLLPHMLERGHGRILNVASMAGVAPVAGMAVYAATKSYAIHVSHALRRELKGSGVSVTVLVPGPIATDMLADVISADVGSVSLMPTLAAVDVAAAAIDGLEGGRATVVPGLLNAIAYYGAQVLPAAILEPLANARLQRRADPVAASASLRAQTASAVQPPVEPRTQPSQ